MYEKKYFWIYRGSSQWCYLHLLFQLVYEDAHYCIIDQTVSTLLVNLDRGKRVFFDTTKPLEIEIYPFNRPSKRSRSFIYPTEQKRGFYIFYVIFRVWIAYTRKIQNCYVQKDRNGSAIYWKLFMPLGINSLQCTS